jgi:hypothetical protein
MLKRRLLLFMATTALVSGVVVGTTVLPAAAGPLPAIGPITCSMTGVTTFLGKVVHGLSVAGNHHVVRVGFAASFTCAPPAAVAFPVGVNVTGGNIKGVAKYDHPTTGGPGNADACVNFNGPDSLVAAKVVIHWTQLPAAPPIRPTTIRYTNLGPGTIGGGVITLMGPVTKVSKTGSFVAPNPPNTVQLITNLYPNSPCPAVAPPFTPFVISGGTIHV